ncbi:hypothetical protein [Chromatium okenii]|uniref:hypothetical protein n=1 Tax=Chromatium okenii TaxID=61644 RepID=UPI001F5B0D3B|nr:hypothetical protein [Chromatium okenii]
MPSGTVKIDVIVMRIAHLLLMNDDQQELPRLLARVGLNEARVKSYRPNADADSSVDS